MIKHTFRYCSSHKQDEAYMQAMCARGWAVRSLREGFWSFEPCTPGEFCFRVCYLRGMKPGQVEALKARYAARGIEFVSRYSFWAIFRSREPFRLYSPQEERAVCRRIFAPMPIGAAVSWVLFLILALLSRCQSPYFWIPAVPVGVYGAMCTWLALSYRRLLKSMP